MSGSLVLPGDHLKGSLVTSVLGLVWRLMVLLSSVLVHPSGLSPPGEYQLLEQLTVFLLLDNTFGLSEIPR